MSGAIRPAGDAVHIRGCPGDNVYPSGLLDGWEFCRDCRRIIAPAHRVEVGA